MFIATLYLTSILFDSEPLRCVKLMLENIEKEVK